MKELKCGQCGVLWQKLGRTNCWSADPATAPAKPGYCPSRDQMPLIRKSFEHYRDGSDDARIAEIAMQVEGLCYERSAGDGVLRPRWTRVEDTIAFAKLSGYTRIGIATCIGLLDETNRLSMVLEAQGFEPLSVCCKTGSIDKCETGVDQTVKVRPGTFEPLCNPIAQARILNKAKTDLNIIMGLCVGHDMLFTKHSKAPVTTLVVKDRVAGHNPVSVLYGQNFYYRRLQTQPIDVPQPGPPKKKPRTARAKK